MAGSETIVRFVAQGPQVAVEMGKVLEQAQTNELEISKLE
jgi:hypothetical protein